MRVIFVASEVLPFAKTGGLADVSGTLPKALSDSGAEVMVFMPLYSQIEKNKYSLTRLVADDNIQISIGSKTYTVHLYHSKLPDSNVDTIFIDCPELFDRKTLYTIEADEGIRFGLFNLAVIESLQRLQISPDIIHCNDWQTGLIPILIKENYSWDKLFADTSVVFTIHNIAYQGIFSKDLIEDLKLNKEHFFPQGPLEYNGELNFLKAGIIFADVINTVSKTYAEEILTKEFGAGMEDILVERKKDMFGILNGVDYKEWDPEIDALIPYRFSRKNLEGKSKNKTHLLQQAGFKEAENIPLIGIVSRMVEQKGTELIMDIVDDLAKLDVNWVILGSGMKDYELMFRKITNRYREKFFVTIGYDNKLAHLIEAGADMFLMPSRYEPCGLNQIYSLKYGTVPIVRFTGGLADTVHDSEVLEKNGDSWTGFVFKNYNSRELYKTIVRAIDVYKDKKLWTKIMTNGMKKVYSWESAAQSYLNLYKQANERKVKKNETN